MRVSDLLEFRSRGVPSSLLAEMNSVPFARLCDFSYFFMLPTQAAHLAFYVLFGPSRMVAGRNIRVHKEQTNDLVEIFDGFSYSGNRQYHYEQLRKTYNSQEFLVYLLHPNWCHHPSPVE